MWADLVYGQQAVLVLYINEVFFWAGGVCPSSLPGCPRDPHSLRAAVPTGVGRIGTLEITEITLILS